MLGIFARIPSAGTVKTRLHTALSKSGAERFYAASLADTLETAARVCERPVLFLADADPSPVNLSALRDTLLAAGLEPATWERLDFAAQHGADLGRRMENALARLGADGASPALLAGSDSPSLPPDRLAAALRLLRAAGAASSEGCPDVVLGPAADGGYYAIGVRRPVPGLLHDVAWSTESALSDTVRRAERLGLRVALLDPWTDVDRPGDLPELAIQIAGLRAAGDARTGRHSESCLRSLGWPGRSESA